MQQRAQCFAKHILGMQYATGSRDIQRSKLRCQRRQAKRTSCETSRNEALWIRRCLPVLYVYLSCYRRLATPVAAAGEAVPQPDCQVEEGAELADYSLRCKRSLREEGNPPVGFCP